MGLMRINAFSLGFAALACLLAGPTWAGITYEMVTVGNPGNAVDRWDSHGRVDYEYQIGKYDVTIGQYTAFLNAVAATDAYSLYKSSMSTDGNIAGIQQNGSDGGYTYNVINNGGDSSNRPITYVSWLDAARFSNWMANGQPVGAQDSTTTEDGTYSINGAMDPYTVGKNLINPNTNAAPKFYIPTEDEWYKAAYYSPNHGGVGTPGYYAYATQSDTDPGNIVGSTADQANYRSGGVPSVGVYVGGVYSVTQSATYDPNQNYLTDVGAFTNSSSFYGTFDQSGNVLQWTDQNGNDTSGWRTFRGGSWKWNDPAYLSANSYAGGYANFAANIVGIRLASPLSSITPDSVPEIDPATGSSALSLLGGLLAMIEQRRRHGIAADLSS